MSVLPRIVHGANPIPGEWLTPPEKANTFVQPHEVRAYLNGDLVEWAEIVCLDELPPGKFSANVNGYTAHWDDIVYLKIKEYPEPMAAPPHVEAMYPDGNPLHLIEGGKVVTSQPRRKVLVYGYVEIRRQTPKVWAETDDIYDRAYGRTVKADGGRIKTKAEGS